MSSNIILKFQGQSKNISEWAEAIGLKYSTVYNRYRKYVQGLISIESVLNPERILVRGRRKPRPLKGPRKKGWKCNLTDEERLRRSRQLLSIIQKRKKLKDLTDGRS